jgi:hypothetical protein
MKADGFEFIDPGTKYARRKVAVGIGGTTKLGWRIKYRSEVLNIARKVDGNHRILVCKRPRLGAFIYVRLSLKTVTFT